MNEKGRRGFQVLHVVLGSLLVLGLIAGKVEGAQYLIKLKNPTNAFQIQSFESSGFEVTESQSDSNLMMVEANPTDLPQVLAKLATPAQIEYVVPNYKLYSIPSLFHGYVNPENQKQYALEITKTLEALQVVASRGLREIRIAVIDTGVDSQHLNLIRNMLPGYDFVTDKTEQTDVVSKRNPGHGTHCAGIAAGDRSVTGGISGSHPTAKIIPLRFLDETGSGDLNNAIKAIDFAIRAGAHVISASWGARVPDRLATPLVEAIDRANKAGVVFVAAAGNDGANNDTTPIYPANANLPNVIAVAASDQSDKLTSWSNFGIRNVHVSAPGFQIISTLPQNRYGLLSGTSMATPLVSGVVALIRSIDANLQPSEIRSLLMQTGDKTGANVGCNCRINTLEAINSIIQSRPFVHPASEVLKVGYQGQISVKNARGLSDLRFISSNPTAVFVDAKTGVFRTVGVGVSTIAVESISRKNLIQSSVIHVIGDTEASTHVLTPRSSCAN